MTRPRKTSDTGLWTSLPASEPPSPTQGQVSRRAREQLRPTATRPRGSALRRRTPGAGAGLRVPRRGPDGGAGAGLRDPRRGPSARSRLQGGAGLTAVAGPSARGPGRPQPRPHPPHTYLQARTDRAPRSTKGSLAAAAPPPTPSLPLPERRGRRSAAQSSVERPTAEPQGRGGGGSWETDGSGGPGRDPGSSGASG